MKKIGLIAGALFMSLVMQEGASAQSLYGNQCPGYAARSPASNVKLNVTFKNHSPAAQKIYWVDFNGRLKLYQTLQPGRTYTVNTYRGHMWLVWEWDHCNYWFTAARNKEVITLR